VDDGTGTQRHEDDAEGGDEFADDHRNPTIPTGTTGLL
jgi:hypothetical protein